MPAHRHPSELSREELIDRVLALEAQVQRLIDAYERAIAELDQLRRGGPGTASRIPKSVPPPARKKSGRRSGEGTFRSRLAPEPGEVTEVIEVPLDPSIERCECGGELGPVRQEMAYNTDLPPAPRPVVMGYRVSVCRCQKCGRSVRGKHPDLAPDQYGASSHRLGLRAMAQAHELHYHVGIPLRKVPFVLLTLTGLRVTQGALTQDVIRRTSPGGVWADGTPAPDGKVYTAYQSLRQEIGQAPWVHTDDTGWKVDGKGAYLMGFQTMNTTVFQIRLRHRNEEVRELIPSDYPGTMITDQGTSYNAREFETVKQQKCVSHILELIRDVTLNRLLVVQSPKRPTRAFRWCTDLKKLFQEGNSLHKEYRAGTEPDLTGHAERLSQRLTKMLSEPVRDRACRSLQRGLMQHHRRGNLLRFLFDPDIEPTNNRAERALRPAVIARKVSHCSKNERGALAHAALASVICTLRQRSDGPITDALRHVFATGQMPCLSP